MSFDIASFHAIPIFSKGSFFTSAELLLRQILLHCFAYSQVQLFLDYSGNKYEFAYSKSFFELHDWFFCVLSVVETVSFHIHKDSVLLLLLNLLFCLMSFRIP